MNRYYDYTSLGESCQTSLRVLTDNRKFLAPNDIVYNLMYTRMQRYPLYPPKNSDMCTDDDVNQLSYDTENKKVEKDEKDISISQTKMENFSCCGK
jgi:hypothetical protein